MIPKVKNWRVRTEDWEFVVYVPAPTKRLALIGVSMDYPETWGERLIASPMLEAWIPPRRGEGK